MKDYHDLILIIREPGLVKFNKLGKSIKNTFEHRGTRLILPISFDESGTQGLQKLWTDHLRGLGDFKDKLKLPDQIKDVISELNQLLSALVP